MPIVLRRGCRSGLLASTAIGGLFLGVAGQPALGQQIILTGEAYASTAFPAPDASYWDAGDLLSIAEVLNGSLLIGEGSQVESDITEIGYLSGSGTITVDGSSTGGTASALISDSLTVGVIGQGTLNLVDGGRANITGSVLLGEVTGSTGTLNFGMGGESGTLDATSISVGRGRGIINFNHTGTLNFGTTVSILPGRNLTMNQIAGYTRVNGASPNNDAAINISGGTLAITRSNSIGSGLITMDGGTFYAEGDASLTNDLRWSDNETSTIAAASGTTLAILADYIYTGSNADVRFGTVGETGVVEITNPGSYGVGGATRSYTIDAGTLRFGGAVTAGSLFRSSVPVQQSDLTVASEAFLDVNGFATRVENLRGAGSIVNLGAGDATVTINTQSTSNFAGSLADGASGGRLGVVLNGASTQTLSGVSTFMGDMVVRGTTVVLSGSVATPAISLQGITTLQVDGGAFTGAPVITFNSDTTLDITSNGGPVSVGALRDASAANLQLNTDNELRFVGTGDTQPHVFSGAISGTGSLVVNNGDDVQWLTGASTHEGETRIVDGTLVISHENGLGLNTSGGVDPGTFVEAGGTLELRGFIDVVSDRLFIGGGSIAGGDIATLRSGSWASYYGANVTLTGGDAAFDATAGNALNVRGAMALGSNTLSLTGPGGHNLSGNITGTGGLRKVGSGDASLSGNNSFTGSTVIQAGSLGLFSGNAIADTAAVVVNAGGRLNNFGNETIGSLSGAGRVSAFSDLTVGAANTDTVFSGSYASTNDLFKTGTGTWTLTGDLSLFSGDTTVLRGALVINTDTFGTGDGTLNIGSLGTLGGAGTIMADVSVEGRLAPGNSPETLTIAGDLTLNGSSTSVFELNTPGQVGGDDPLTGNDLVIVEGNLTLGGTLDLTNPGDTPVFAGYYTLFQVDGTTTGSFADVDTPDTQITPISVGDIYVTNGGAEGNEVNLLVGGDQVQFWDGGELVADGVVDGGAGTWNGTRTNWTTVDGAINDQWRGQYAVFDGAGGGTVTVADTPTFSRLQFRENGYEITGGDLAALGDPNDAIQPDTFAVVTVDAGISATISSNIADAAGGSYLFIKSGAGALTLSGTTTFGDGIFAGEGTLVTNGTHNGDLSINSPAALLGSGVINGSVFNNGTLAGIAGQTLTMASLGMSAGSITDVALGTPSDIALFNVTNDLTLDGTLNVTDAGGFSPGVYRLFDYGGTITDNRMDIGTLPSGSTVSDWAVQTSVAGQVNLVNATSGIAFWDGAEAAERDNGVVDDGSGFWAQDNLNWTNADGTVNAAYGANPRFAVFQGTGGLVTINDTPGPISATGLQFAGTGYEVFGDSLNLTPDAVIRVGDGSADDASKIATIAAEIIGTDITKEGAGTLILNESNAFADLNLNEGVVSIVDSTDLGNATGTVTFGGGTLNAGGTTTLASTKAMVATSEARFDVDAGQTLTVAGTVSGAGDVVKTGAGTLSLTNSSNSYGNTTVEAGTLVGNSASIRGNIENAGLVIFDQNDFGIFSGTISAFGATAGTMEKRGGAMLGLDGASTLDWRVTGGTLVSQNASFTGDVEVTATGNFAFMQTGTRSYAGALSGTGSVLTNSGTLELTGNNAGYGGTLLADAGTLTLTSDFGGDLQARSAGRIVVNSMVAGDVTDIGTGSTLTGQGAINGSVGLTDGTLEGAAGRVLTMGSLSMASVSNMNVTLGAPSSDTLFDVAGNLILDGTLNVTEGAGFGAGVYRLVDYGGTLTNFGLNIGATPAGTASADLSVQTALAGQVNLVNAAGTTLNFWDGDAAANRNNDTVDGGDGRWTATLDNWTTSDGSINAAYSPNPTFAVFQGTGGTVSIINDAGAISASGLQFASDGYTIDGSGLTLSNGGDPVMVRVGDMSADDASKVATISAPITGDALRKTGAGTLVLTRVNAFSGLELAEGTVSVSARGNMGSITSGVTFSGGTLLATSNFTSTLSKTYTATADARFAVNADRTLIVEGIISGPGDLVKMGAGTLVVGNLSNAYGDTIVEAGTLYGRVGSIDGNIQNAGHVIFDQGSTADPFEFVGTINGFGGTSGTMEKRGGSLLSLRGSSTLDWRVSEGTLATSAGFTGDVQVDAGATFLLSQPIARGYSGDLTGNGRVSIFGGNVLMTGDNSGFTGVGTVESATLRLNSAFGGNLSVDTNGRVEVNDTVAGNVQSVVSTGRLSGTGTIVGSVSNLAGTLQGASGSVLSMGALAMQASATMTVTLGAPSTDALFDVAGDLTLDGTLNVTDAGGFSAGVYRLVDYGGTLNDNGMVIGATPAGTSAGAMSVQTSVAGQVNLVNASGLTLGFWDGGLAANRDNGLVDGGSGTWNVTNSNWTDINGTINAPYNPNPTFAVFQGTGGTVTIDNNPGSVQVTGLQFASDGYTVTGAPLTLNNGADPATVRVGDGTNDATMVATFDTVLMGSSLRKTGGGTLVLSQLNSFIGMELVAGTVSVSAQSQMGTTSGGVTFSGGTLRVTDSFQTDFSKVYTANADARFDVASARVLAANGIISGAGDVVKTGDGVLTLGNAGNAYGDTIVEAGTLLGSAGTIRGNIENAGHVIFDQGSTGTFSGTIGARGGVAGTMEKRGGAVLTLAGNSTLDWQVNGGTLATTVSMTFSGDAQIDSAGELRFTQSGNRAYGGDLTGTGDLIAFGGTLTLSGNNAAFAGTGMAHSGNLTLDSAFGGDVSARNGRRLTVNDTVAGDVTEVIASAVLTGSGAITGSVTMSDGSLEGASGRVLGMGALTMASSTTMDVTLGAPSTAALFDVTGDLTLDGTLNISDAGGFSAGVYRLVDYGGTLTDNGLAIGSVPGSVTAGDLSVQTAVAGQVNLVNTFGVALSFWDGGAPANRDNGVIDGGMGTWNATNSNWTTQDGSFNAAYTPNPTFAVFQGTGGTVTIDNTDGLVQATGLQFASDGYTVGGETLTLSNGGNPAIVRVGSGSAGDAALTASISANINGETLRKQGAGTLVLAGTNGFDGLALAEGTVAVGADANLGRFGSTVTFSGGTLRATETFTTDASRFFEATADAGIEVDTGRTLTVDGVIYGLGDLVKTGDGVLVLGNTGNSYNDTIVEAGTLLGNTGSIVGNIENAGRVVFDQDFDGTYAYAIGASGTTEGRMLKRGSGTVTLTAASSLEWDVREGKLVSASVPFTGDLGIDSGAAFGFEQQGDRTYAGVLSGTGDLTVDGGRLYLTGDASHFMGSARVTDATMWIDDTFGGALTLVGNSRLEGNGTVGDGTVVTVMSGSTIAPGNSIGRIDVDGDLTFMAGSVYEVETNPGATGSDVISVDGVANLAGTVAHVGLDGDYAASQSYEILMATGGITGTFDVVTSDYAFLDTSLGYGATTVMLTLDRNDVGFADIGRTPNQRATASGIESLGAGQEPYDAIVQLDAATAREAYDQLSGEGHATAMTGMVEDSDEIRDAVSDRIRASFGGAGDTTQGGTFSSKSAKPVDSPVWLDATGTWRRISSDGNAGAYTSLSGGLMLGVDAMVEDAVRLGVLAGYGRSQTNVPTRNFRADATSYHVGVYAGAEMGGFTVSGGAAYSWHDVTASRSVAFAGFTDTLDAEYGAGVLQAFGELSYGFETTAAYFEPFLSVAHVRVARQGFTETGGAGALTASAASYATTYATAGLRAETGFVLGSSTGTLHGSVGWRQAFGDRTPDQDMAFAGSGPFSIAGAPIIGGAAVLGAGFEVDLSPGMSLGLSYDGQISRAAQSHGISANFNFNF